MFARESELASEEPLVTEVDGPLSYDVAQGRITAARIYMPVSRLLGQVG